MKLDYSLKEWFVIQKALNNTGSTERRHEFGVKGVQHKIYELSLKNKDEWLKIDKEWKEMCQSRILRGNPPATNPSTIRRNELKNRRKNDSIRVWRP